tara:strand:- start:1 stop:501 length:501 start_codon:yes stop_codon:yes gene_type:complete
MTHYIRLVFIGLLILAIGHWVGLGTKPDIDKIPGCDASLQSCLDQNQSTGTNTGTGTKTATSLQVIGAAKDSTQGQPITTPALIHINAKGITADRSVGRITGVNMYMGQFDVTFKRNNGQWQGITSLPNCVNSHPMVWVIELLVADKKATELTPTNSHFLFSSHQN